MSERDHVFMVTIDKDRRAPEPAIDLKTLKQFQLDIQKYILRKQKGE